MSEALERESPRLQAGEDVKPDCIHLQGIRAYGYTGVLPAEQTLGQWFEVNVSLWVDLALAGKSDRSQTPSTIAR